MDIRKSLRDAADTVGDTAKSILNLPVVDPIWGFERKPMVAWFSPKVLANAALRAALTSTISQFGDRRDSQGSLGDPVPIDLSGDDTITFDFVADTGDGFESTFAVARVMAEERLELRDDDSPDKRVCLPASSLILFGGDEVYPDAHENAYEDRFIGPYNAAFRHRSAAELQAVAIPGNHDWYDGLMKFMLYFCRSKPDGTFENIATPQRRSYWAVKLPHDWMCLGLDWHVGGAMDLPQWEYFEAIVDAVEQPTNFILVVPNPVWVQYFSGRRQGYRELSHFIERVCLDSKTSGHRVSLVLSGDLHCYARYTVEPGDAGGDRQMIMAGGGGAYLYPTHGLPCVSRRRIEDGCKLALDNGAASRRRHRIRPRAAPAAGGDVDYMRAASVYPEPGVTSRTALKSIGLVVYNPALAIFLVGPLYLLLNYAFRRTDGASGPTALWKVWDCAVLTRASALQSLETFLNSLYTLTGLSTATALLVALVVWAHESSATDDGIGRFRGPIVTLMGLLHAAFHFLLAMLSVWFIAALRSRFDGSSLLATFDVVFVLALVYGAVAYRLPKSMVMAVALFQAMLLAGLVFYPVQTRVVLLSEQVIVFAGVAGTCLLGLYLVLANLLGGHSNDVLACQSRSTCKNFVRMQIDAEGTLHIWPIGIDRPPDEDRWQWQDDRFVLRDGEGEEPVDIGSIARLIDAEVPSISGASRRAGG